MWAAIVKGTAKAGEFITHTIQNKRATKDDRDDNTIEKRCPWTNILISEDEYRENKGDANFHPKWRLRRNPNASGYSSDKCDIEYSNQLLIDRIRVWGKKNRFLHPPTLKIEGGKELSKTVKDLQILNYKHRGFSTVVASIGSDVFDESHNIARHRITASYNPWFICSKMEPKRPHLEPQDNDVCFPVPYNTPGDDSSIDLANLYLWPLLHSRSDDVVACRTFGDWKRLFYATIHLAFPSYHEWMILHNTPNLFITSSERAKLRMFDENINPSRALYLLSIKSNFWPYGHESHIPKWTTSPYRQSFISTNLKDRVAELEEMKRKYPKNSVFSVSKKTTPSSSSTKNPEPSLPRVIRDVVQEEEEEEVDAVVAVEGGRNATGLCSVKKRKIHGDAAEITWFVNAKFLRNMKRVHLFLERSPWPKIHDDFTIFENN